MEERKGRGGEGREGRRREKRGGVLGGELINVKNTGSRSLQLCPVTELEAMGPP